MHKQDQLSHRETGLAMLLVIEYFTESLKITQCR